jgi:phosphohistidine swiveling domain-containing protein
MYPVHHLGSGDALPHDAGAKARQTVRLHELAARGAPFHVPPAFIVPPTAIADVLAAIGIPAADVDAEFAACVQAADLDLARRWRQRLQVVAFPPSLVETLRQHWTRLTAAAPEVPLAVRSSFHAEDSAVRSFAGVFESVLDVRGPEMLVRAARSVYASLLSDRSLAYLADDPRAAVPRMSLIVQRMAIGPGWTGGVAYSRAPELHAAHVSLIAASRDAPSVTSGATIPEEYLVLRTPARAPLLLQRSAGTSTAITGFLLDDEARASLVRALAAIEDDFGHPVELEWTRRPDGCVFVLQARAAPTHAADALDAPVRALRPPLLTGLAIGHGEFAGTVCRTDRREDATHLGPGDVLVTRLTTPDWDPILARVGALVTAAGGRTSHAARLARERRMLAVVGCGPAIDRLSTGRRVLLVCADGLAGELHDADVPRGRASARPSRPSRPRGDTHTPPEQSAPTCAHCAARCASRPSSCSPTRSCRCVCAVASPATRTLARSSRTSSGTRLRWSAPRSRRARSRWRRSRRTTAIHSRRRCVAPSRRCAPATGSTSTWTIEDALPRRRRERVHHAPADRACVLPRQRAVRQGSTPICRARFPDAGPFSSRPCCAAMRP